MESLKQQKVSFYVYAIVTVLSLVSLFTYIANVNTPYYEDMNTYVLLLLLGGALSLILVLVLSLKTNGKGAKVVTDLLKVLAATLIMVSCAEFIGMRVESFGYIFGSNLEMGNEAAFTAGQQAIVEIIILVVTWVLAVFAAFLKGGKKVAK